MIQFVNTTTVGLDATNDAFAEVGFLGLIFDSTNTRDGQGSEIMLLLI